MTDTPQPYFQRPPGWQPESVDAPKPNHTRTLLVGGVAVLVVAAILVGFFVWKSHRDGGAQQVAEQFATALFGSDCPAAEALSTDHLRAKAPDCSDLPNLPLATAGIAVHPQVRVTEEAGDTATAEVKVEVFTMSATLILDLVRTGDQWLVDDIRPGAFDQGELGDLPSPG